MFEREIQIWPEVAVKKVTMQCVKMKLHTAAYYPYKINRTNHFPPILSDLNTRNWFFLIIGISIGFPFIPDIIFSSSARVLTNILIFYILRSV